MSRPAALNPGKDFRAPKVAIMIRSEGASRRGNCSRCAGRACVHRTLRLVSMRTMTDAGERFGAIERTGAATPSISAVKPAASSVSAGVPSSFSTQPWTTIVAGGVAAGDCASANAVSSAAYVARITARPARDSSCARAPSSPCAAPSRPARASCRPISAARTRARTGAGAPRRREGTLRRDPRPTGA